MKIASIQMNVGDEDKSQRLARAEALLDQVGDADLVILPEIWNVGYFSFELYEREAEAIDGETATRMAAKAKQHGFFLHMGSFVESYDHRLYNTSLLVDRRGERIACYRKIHLFGYGSQESRLLSRGSEIIVVDTPFGKIGMSTCYDLRFPELFRAMLNKGAELFLVPSGWPYPRLEHWIMFNRIRAIENSAYLASSNCVGKNRGSQFCGHSMVVDPWGVILAGGGDEEAILGAQVDLEKARAVRQTFPAVRDRVLQNHFSIEKSHG
jgi:predicted amidohydrolase